MGESMGPSADQDPIFQLETLTGPQFDYYLVELLTRSASALTLDSYRLVSVKERGVNRETGVVTVVCQDDERHRHQLSYTLDPDSPVAHELLEDEPDSRA